MQRIALTYSDGNVINLNVSNEKFDKFFKDLSSGQIYRDGKHGFWTDLNCVHYIQTEEIDDVKSEDTSSSSELPKSDDADQENKE